MDIIRKFYEDLKADEEFKKKVQNAEKQLREENAGLSDNEIFARIAKDNGYDISVEMLEQIDVDGQKMDENELDMVSGGHCIYTDKVCFFSDQKHVFD